MSRLMFGCQNAHCPLSECSVATYRYVTVFSMCIIYVFFFFHWHYSPLWALACRTVSFHFSYLPPTLSIFSLPALEDLFFTSSFHLFLGRPFLLIPSSSWAKIFLGILSSSILSRWPNQLIPCLLIHFTIFSPLFVSSSSRFVLLSHSPFSWCRVLLEKLTGLQLVKKFPAFHGTRRFITVLASVWHLSLSWASPIQSIYPHPTTWRSILMLSTHLRLGLPSGLFPSGFSSKILYTPLSSPIRATCPAHLILLDFITRTILGEEYKSFSSSLCNLLHSPDTSSLLGPNILLNTMFSNTLSFLSSRNVSDQVSHPSKWHTHNSSAILSHNQHQPVNDV